MAKLYVYAALKRTEKDWSTAPKKTEVYYTYAQMHATKWITYDYRPLGYYGIRRYRDYTPVQARQYSNGLLFKDENGRYYENMGTYWLDKNASAEVIVDGKKYEVGRYFFTEIDIPKGEHSITVNLKIHNSSAIGKQPLMVCKFNHNFCDEYTFMEILGAITQVPVVCKRFRKTMDMVYNVDTPEIDGYDEFTVKVTDSDLKINFVTLADMKRRILYDDVLLEPTLPTEQEYQKGLQNSNPFDMLTSPALRVKNDKEIELNNSSTPTANGVKAKNVNSATAANNGNNASTTAPNNGANGQKNANSPANMPKQTPEPDFVGAFGKDSQLSKAMRILNHATGPIAPVIKYDHVTESPTFKEKIAIFDYQVDGQEITVKKLLKAQSEVEIPLGVTRIAEGAFSNVPFVERVLIPRTVNYIGARAFYNNKTIRVIHYPEGKITTIYWDTFYGCSNLRNILLPKSDLKDIQSGAFKGVATKEIYVPKYVRIMDGAFDDDCYYLRGEGGDKVALIAQCKREKAAEQERRRIAFEEEQARIAEEERITKEKERKERLIKENHERELANRKKRREEELKLQEEEEKKRKELSDKKRVEKLAMAKLEQDKLREEEQKAIAKQKSQPIPPTKITVEIKDVSKKQSEVKVVQKAEQSDKKATTNAVCKGDELISFSGNKQVVTVPENVRRFAKGAFNNPAITKVEFCCEIEELPAELFKNNKTVEEIILPESLKVIKNGAFEGCSSLKKVIAYRNVHTIENNAFKGCICLNELHFEITKATHLCLKKLGESAFENCGKLKKFIANDIAVIEKRCFLNCKELVLLESFGVGTIGEEAFKNCEKLEKFDLYKRHIDDTISLIEVGAFENCVKLKSFVYTGKKVDIRGGAFKNCHSLEWIEFSYKSDLFPDFAISGKCPFKSAFEGCSSLKNIVYDGKKSVIKALDGDNKIPFKIVKSLKKKFFFF